MRRFNYEQQIHMLVVAANHPLLRGSVVAETLYDIIKILVLL